MAGAGYMTFADGQVLTAAQVNTYLMQQSVMVFATAAARTTALPSPSEGMVTYRSDNNVIEYYDGAAWQPILDQDVIAAKGDLIVGTGDDTVSRLAVGTDTHVLTADSSTATGLKWAAPVTALTLVKTQTIGSGVSSVAVTSAFSSSYDQYLITISNCAPSQNADYTMTLGSLNTTYYWATNRLFYDGSAAQTAQGNNTSSWRIGTYTTTGLNCAIHVSAPFLTQAKRYLVQAATTGEAFILTGILNSSTSQTDFTITAGAGNMTGGTIRVYGYANS